MNSLYRIVLISNIVLFSLTSAFANDAYNRVTTGTSVIGISLDSDANGIGNIYSPSAQYFIVNNLFVEGGLRFAQSVIDNGVSYNSKSYGILVGMGGAVPLNNFVILSLKVDYSNYFYDLTYNGSSQPGSVDTNGIGMGVNIEFFVNPKTSLMLGISYQSQSGNYRDTGTSIDSHGGFFTTGWKFYFD